MKSWGIQARSNNWTRRVLAVAMCLLLASSTVGVQLRIESASAAGVGLADGVSLDSSGVQGNLHSFRPSISADGRYVAFQSYASNLVPGDTNGLADIFVKDRTTDTTRRISTDSAGVQGNGEPSSPAISADGRYVAFLSSATNLVPGDTNGVLDVFVKDTATGTTRRVSTDASGAQANYLSNSLAISADGRYVAFQSYASNLVPGVANSAGGIFLKDTTTGMTRFVSGAGGNGSIYPSISTDGRYVAFLSSSPDIVPGDTNSADDFFVTDMSTGTTRRVSTDSSGGQSNGYAVRTPSISGNGRFVAFGSAASNLAPSDTNSTQDIFVKDTATGTTRRVSTDSLGGQGNSYSTNGPSISTDGRYVVFLSLASNLAPGDTNGTADIFVKDITTGITRRVSTDSAGAQGNGGSTDDPSISGDGRYVAFSSHASNLVPGDTNGAYDIFVKDTATGTTRRVSTGSGVDLPVAPVPPVPGNDDTALPILVLIAGYDSNTGHHPVGPWVTWQWPFSGQWNDSKSVGDPWKYLGGTIDGTYPTMTDDLGAFKVMVMPTDKHSSDWPQDARDAGYVIDSLGRLDYNIKQLAAWLLQQDELGEFGDHPIVLIGHSYGGVIARSMLASNQLSDSVRDNIKAIIQFGSPNGGTGAADFATENYGFMRKTDASQDLMTGAMETWNRINRQSPVGVPVVRFAGSYLPDVTFAMDSKDYQLMKALLWSSWHGHEPNDGIVAVESMKDGFGTLPDIGPPLRNPWRDFGGGAFMEFSTLTHAKDAPGTNQTYGGVTYHAIVPQPSDGSAATLLSPLIKAIANPYASSGALLGTESGDAGFKMASADSSADSETAGRRVSSQSGAKLAGERAEAAASEAAPSRMLPERTVPVASGGSAQVTLPLDAPANLIASSAEGTPIVTVRDEAGVPIESPNWSDLGADGITTSLLRVEPASPGNYTLDITLLSGSSGIVTLTGVMSGGAQLTLSADESFYAGDPQSVTAQFESASGEPLLRATVSGTAELVGEADVALTFRDDGAAGDAVADDGIYTSAFTAPVRGRWLARVEARHSSAERAGSLVIDVGAALATVTGPLTEVTPAAPGSTLASFGVGVPLHVSEAGVYTATGALTDAAGAQVGVVRASSSLAADESTTLVADIDASQLSGIAEGALTIAPLRITRYTGGIELEAGSGPGLTTSRTYAATDFHAFSISLSGPDANPGPTNAVHFTGTALNTASTVASIEYTIDGGASWTPVAPSDGAFDSHAEDFMIDHTLPDYVYGILVRQTGADGTQLPVADWAGIRFTVDTVAPAQVADLAALVTTEAESSVAHASWLPSDPPSDTVSSVRYVVTLDDTEVGTIYDTAFDVALPDTGLHTLTVTPVDDAGNRGPSQTTPVLHTTQVAAGWNLLAGDADSDTGGQVLFGFDGASYASLQAVSMEGGRGYWCKFSSPATVTLRFSPSPVSVHLHVGWNLIGNSTAQTLSLPAGMTAFVFDGTSYRSTTTLEPGEGAWVRATEAGDVVLEAAG